MRYSIEDRGTIHINLQKQLHNKKLAPSQLLQAPHKEKSAKYIQNN